MNEQDKKAFEDLASEGFRNIYLNNLEKAVAEYFWQAALEYARGQQEPAAWSVVFNAVKQAIALCKNATGQHSTISRYVNAAQITHDALETDTTNPAPAQPVQPVAPVAWTNSYQLSYLQEPKYGLTPMAMWATAFDETTIPLYTTPPAAAINEQLLEALKAAVACGMVPSMSARSGGACAYVEQLKVADQIRAAIAAAEAQIKHGGAA